MCVREREREHVLCGLWGVICARIIVIHIATIIITIVVGAFSVSVGDGSDVFFWWRRGRMGLVFQGFFFFYMANGTEDD